MEAGGNASRRRIMQVLLMCADEASRGKGSAHDWSSRGNAEPQKNFLWGR